MKIFNFGLGKLKSLCRNFFIFKNIKSKIKGNIYYLSRLGSNAYVIGIIINLILKLP